MTAEQQLIDSALRAWKFNADRIETFFKSLSDEELEREIAPGRNRLLYLLGHIASINDAMLPLLGVGPRLHPELEAIFVANPDRAEPIALSGTQLKQIASEIDRALWSAFSKWSAADWLAKHTAVSDEDFAKEPYRNRFSVLLSRNTHMAFHYGQMILAKPRA
jgi:hypothetical protein